MNRVLAAIGVAFLLVVPFVTRNPFYQHLLIMVLFWTLLGIAWNLLGGFAGQVSFGHAAFLGVGAYTTMLLYLKLGWSPWLGLILGGVVGALVALPIGFICFRLRGPYFSLATLAVAEIIRLVALNWETLTAGPTGLLITQLPALNWFGRPVNWESKLPFYYIAVALALFAMGTTWFVSRSRLGAYLLAIREDMDSAEAAGIDTTRTKVAALAISAFIAGLAGGFYGLYFRYIDPDAVFSISMSVEMVFIAVVGGIATTAGPIVGAVFLVTISEFFRERFQVGHLIFYGVLMMIVIRYMPDGIWGRLRRWLLGATTQS
ncbi:MAG TPA: branched-chain amino acid ABC transporter permease [Casimicrobiaceae bacterium]|nr:branched-chain amino acid ABC transporter permease [Casimicrobiaceae bacterium]